MSEALYQRQILALASRDDGEGVLEDATARIRKSNPLCGDEVLLTARIENGRIVAFARRVRGCVLCRAATARFWMWKESQTLDAAALRDFAAQARRMFDPAAAGGARDSAAEGGAPDALKMFAPVIAHPSRYGCVLLPFWAAESLADILAAARRDD